MQRFYYVSYLYSKKNSRGYGCCFVATDEIGIIAPIAMKNIEKDSELNNVTIISFNEISSKQYLISVEESEKRINKED